MRVAFFGVGAVCSVISTLLCEQSSKNLKNCVEFLFIVRDEKKSEITFL